MEKKNRDNPCKENIGIYLYAYNAIKTYRDISNTINTAGIFRGGRRGASWSAIIVSKQKTQTTRIYIYL